MEVGAARPGSKLERVSSRIKRKLIHPNRGGNLVGVRFSPDGKRILAADYPGGVIQVWDTETGRQLAKIDTGRGYKESLRHPAISRDWKTVYVVREKAQNRGTPIEKDGKRLFRFEFDSDVKAWDLETGQLRATFRHSPPRWIIGDMALSPDGATLITNENLSGEWEGGPKRAISVWDVKTRQCRPLCEGWYVGGVLSPDGKTVAVTDGDDADYPFTARVSLFDVATAKKRLAIPVAEKFANVQPTFSPDGTVLVCQVRVWASRTNLRSFQQNLKFWDVASGRELDSFAADKNIQFGEQSFSADGKLVAISQADGTVPAKLHFLESSSGKLIRTMTFDAKSVVGGRAFSHDGKWLAVLSQRVDRPLILMMVGGRVEDFPQPHLHLIDTKSGEVKETLIAPQGMPHDACFSPDGKTLATTGHGAVLLWDLTRPPGTAQKE